MHVNTSHPYDILIERGSAGQLGKLCAELFRPSAKAMVVADSNVAPLHKQRVEDALSQAGFCPASFVFPAGEESKRLDTIAAMYAQMAELSMTRTDFIVALGGGVTGDMAGFAAATYLRGIRFVQVPTSLLAQVDSSVGGKTGVDLPQGKNLVGAFHQPSLVVIDPDLLSTLPNKYWRDGMGEVIKCACISDPTLFELLQAPAEVPEKLVEIITRCVNIKRLLVEEDELDNGPRMLLNFGHTFGHAVEKLEHFAGHSHGEAVSIGMVLMTRLTEAAGLTEPGSGLRIQRLLELHGLPVSTDLPLDRLLSATGVDKKSAGNDIRLAVLSKIGESYVLDQKRQDFLKMAEVLR